MEKHEIFAKNLAAIQAYRGQSLEEFALDLGIPKTTLRSVRASGNTTLNTALLIAEGLGVSLDSLVGDAALPEKTQLTRYLIQSFDRLQTLSPKEREEVFRHFHQILAVICP